MTRPEPKPTPLTNRFGQEGAISARPEGKPKVACNADPYRLVLALFIFELSALAHRGNAFRLVEGQSASAQSKKSSSSVIDLFRNTCRHCHGANGRGDSPAWPLFTTHPIFTDAEWWQKHSKSPALVV